MTARVMPGTADDDAEEEEEGMEGSSERDMNIATILVSTHAHIHTCI